MLIRSFPSPSGAEMCWPQNAGAKLPPRESRHAQEFIYRSMWRGSYLRPELQISPGSAWEHLRIHWSCQVASFSVGCPFSRSRISTGVSPSSPSRLPTTGALTRGAPAFCETLLKAELASLEVGERLSGANPERRQVHRWFLGAGTSSCPPTGGTRGVFAKLGAQWLGLA